MPAVFFNKGLIEAANATKNNSNNTNNMPSRTAGSMARERQRSSGEDPSPRQHPVHSTSPRVVVLHNNGAAATQSTQGTLHSTQPQTQRLDHVAQSPLMPPSQPSELRTPGLGFARLPTPSTTCPFLQRGMFSATPPRAVPCVPTTVATDPASGVVSRTPSGKPPLVPRPPVMAAGKHDVHPHPPAHEHRTEEKSSVVSKAKAVLLEERERSCTLTQNGGASPPKGRHLRYSTGAPPAQPQHRESRASQRTVDGSTIGQSAALDARLLQPHRPPQPALLNRLKEEFAAVQALKRVRSVDTQSRVPISRATLAVWTLTAAIPTPTLTDSVEPDRHNKRDTSTSTTTAAKSAAAPRHRGHVNDRSTKAPLTIAVHIPTEYPFVAPTIEVVRPARSTSTSSLDEVRQMRGDSNDDGTTPRKAPRWSPVSPNPQLICGGLFDGVEHRTPTSSCRGDVASRAASLDASANDHLIITKTLNDDDGGGDQGGLRNGVQVGHSVSGHRAAAVARADDDDDDEDDVRPPAPTSAVRGFEGEVMVTASALPPPEFTSGAAAIHLDTDGLGAGDVLDRTTGRRRHDTHPVGEIDGGWWQEHLQHHFVSVAPSYWTPAMSIAHYINAGLRAAGLPSLGLSRSSDRAEASSLGSDAPDRRSAPHRAVFETVDFRSDVCGDWAEFEGFTSTDGDGEEMHPRSSSSFRRDGSVRSESAKRSRSPDAVAEDHPSPLAGASAAFSASWAPLGNELTSG